MIMVTGGAGFIGANFVLDWLSAGGEAILNPDKLTYAGDHCAALRRVLSAGRPGETYNIGGCNEMANLDVVQAICGALDEMRPRTDGASYRAQVSFVKDRPGHDRRYAIDAGKLERELAWRPAETFASGLRKTLHWYLAHGDWVQRVQSGACREWISSHYAQAASEPA
jgi:dTDP-glucose 4,6-dehydratase